MRPNHMRVLLHLALGMITSVAAAETPPSGDAKVSVPPTVSKPKVVAKQAKPDLKRAPEVNKRPAVKQVVAKPASSAINKPKAKKAPPSKVSDSPVPTELPTVPTAPSVVSEDEIVQRPMKAAIGGLAVTGAEVPDVTRVIMGLRPSITACYEAPKPPANPTAARITANIAVNVDGTVAKVTLTAAGEISEATKACVGREFQKLKFAAPDKAATVYVPITYRDF